MNLLDVVIPVYNEELSVVESTIADIHKAFEGRDDVRVIVVNDGSKTSFGLDALHERDDVTFVVHPTNRGYGSALKTGILSGEAPWVAITDADGTYPVDQLPVLLDMMPGRDMVVGTRTGSVRQIPWLRRFPKFVLNTYASYMAGRRIRDLNSGLRIFTRDLAYHLWDFFPAGFSFTSTITMGSLMSNFEVDEHDINYYKRTGSSSIAPIRDTIRFFRLVSRLGLTFYPERIFYPVSMLIFLLGVTKGIGIDYPNLGYVGNMAIMTMLTGVQIFMVGLIAKLIVNNRFLHPTRSRREVERARLVQSQRVAASRPSTAAPASEPATASASAAQR